MFPPSFFVVIFLIAILLGVKDIPAGYPFVVPPSPCPSSIEFWDLTGDQTVDKLVIKAEPVCNEMFEEKLKENKKAKDVNYSL
jgi:hypothetical protein